MQFGVGSTVSGLALTHFLFLLITNFRVARWDRLLYMFLSGVVPTMLVSLGFTYLLAKSNAEDSKALGGPYLVSIFFIQIVPTIIGPIVQRPVLVDIMKSPVKMGLLSVVLTAAVALVVLDTLTPAYAQAGTGTRILIRVIVFPLLIEIPAGAVRVAARYWLKPDFPMSRLIIFLLSPIVLSSMVGRFLTTNMETISDTIAVSLLLSLMEVFMRSTMLWRDDLYARCCGRPCGGRAGKKKHQRAEAHSWVMFMLFETMVEDVSILLSLPVTLLMRIPPLPGGEPLGAGDVVVRVLIQYVVETLTDVGFALGYYVLTACCGVRYNAVSLAAMKSRHSNTLVRRDEQHRNLFVPLPIRKLARRMSSVSVSSPAQAASPYPGRVALAPSAACPPSKPPRTPLHEVSGESRDKRTTQAATSPILDDSPDPLEHVDSVGVSAPFSASAPPTVLRSQSAGIAAPPDLDRKASATQVHSISSQGKPPAGPTPAHVNVHMQRGSSSGATPVTPSPASTAGLLDDSLTHREHQGTPSLENGDDPQLAFCSCTPCCLPRNHPLARRTRQQLKQELKQEVRWEQEFLWQPIPIGLVVYQANRSKQCLQRPFWRSADAASAEQAAPAQAAPAGGGTTTSPSTDTSAIEHLPPPLVLDADLPSEYKVASISSGDGPSGQRKGVLSAARLASDISESSCPSSAAPIRLSSYDQAEAVRFASDGLPPSSGAYDRALKPSGTLSSTQGTSPAGRPVSHTSKASDSHTPTSDHIRYSTREQALAFDQLIAQQNGTEVDASLDNGLEPTTAQVLTMRIELVAIMFLRGWDTRFKHFNWMLLGGTLAGATYVLRTFVGGALCPFGDEGDPSSWKFDYCTEG